MASMNLRVASSRSRAWAAGDCRSSRGSRVFAFGQPGEREAPLEQAGAAPIELVLHEPRHGLEEVHLVADLKRAGLRVAVMPERRSPRSACSSSVIDIGMGVSSVVSVGVLVPEALVVGDRADAGSA